MEIAVPELTTFIVYLAILIVIGVWVYRRTHTLGDFLLGGRGLNSPTAALSAQASDMSGWLLLGFPGAVYASGSAQSKKLTARVARGVWTSRASRSSASRSQIVSSPVT
jgi:sodium/proline symporter